LEGFDPIRSYGTGSGLGPAFGGIQSVQKYDIY